MAKASEYSMLFKLSAQLGREFGTTFSSAKRTLNDTQREINALNQTQADISAYQKQQQAVESTSRKLSDLQKEYDNIQREIQETEGFSSSLENKLIEKQRAIDKTSESLKNQTDKLHQMESAMQDAGIDTDHLADESKKLTQQMDDLAKKQAEAAKEAQNFGVEGVSSFEAVGSALVAAGIAAGLKAIYDEYKECISIAADFEETMSTVEALSGATAEEMQNLSSYAKQLGATTKFTAKESAEAMTYMGMAGWDAQQMIEGMSGVLNLAAASGEDLAATSDIVTDNLTAFGMKASDTAHFSDVLAAAATNSNTSVAIMGETFKNSAALAGALGYSVEDVAVAIGLMANAGIKGSNAGTALKNVFNGLLGGVTLTAEAFGEVEYSAINADGTMKSFGETMQELRGYFEQMTGAEKMQNAETLAGQRAMAGFVSIMNSTDADFQKLTNNIENCSGAAQKMADIKMDNLNGQLTLMNSAADALKTTIGEAYNEELRALAKVATDILSGINDFLSKHPVLLKALIAITAEIGLIVAAYYGYIAAKKIMNTVRALSTILRVKETAATVTETAATGAQTVATNAATAAQVGLNAAMMANPIGLIIGAVAALTVGLIALVEVMKTGVDESEQLTAASQEQYDQLQSLQSEYAEVCSTMGETSYEAQSLKWQIDELNAAYEESKQTIAEYNEAVEAANQRYDDAMKRHKETVAEVERETSSIAALVNKLSDLTSQTSITAAEKQEILAIIKALNEEIPDLSLNYNEFSGSMDKTIETVKSLAEAEITQRKYLEYQEDLINLMNTKADASDELVRRQNEEAASAQRVADAQYALYEAEAYAARRWVGATPNGPEQTQRYNYVLKYKNALASAEKEHEKAVQDVIDAQNTIQENQAEIDAQAQKLAELVYVEPTSQEKAIEGAEKLSDALSAVMQGYLDVKEAAAYYGITTSLLQEANDEVAEYKEALEAAMEAVESGFYSAKDAAEIYGVTVNAINTAAKVQDTIDKLAELGEQYNEVKEAAEKSINGQYALWDTAAIVIATDIETINTALETQLAYWSDYNTDLANLLARTEDIDGLSEVIASFADGSAESVNAIAGMAAASDEDLRKMVGNWQEVQKQQEEAATSIAELATGFTEELDNMKSDLEDAVDSLNLDDEAAEAAKETVDAYVRAIRDGTDDAVRAAEALRTQVAAALKDMPEITYPSNTHSGGRVPNSGRGGPQIMELYANGTDNAKSGLALVGERGPELVMFNGGEQVLTADETRAYMRQLNDSRNAINAYAEGAGEYTELIMILPTLARMLEAFPRIDAISAGNGQHIVITISPTFSVQGGADMEDTLHAFSDELKDEIFDALEEAGIDAKRGVYA